MPAPSPSPEVQADALLVGGGLASSLIALRLKRARPELKPVADDFEPADLESSADEPGPE